MTRLRCAILDDYFKLSLTSADWSKITDRVDLTVFEKPFKTEAEAASALKDFPNGGSPNPHRVRVMPT